MNNKLQLLANLDRRLVPTDRDAERYLRVQIVAPDASGVRRMPLNVALVIDRSGSMAGTKLDKAKEAAIFCLRNLTGADRAAVVAYDDDVRVVSPSRTLTPETKNRLISEVRTIHSGGSTNLGGGWLTGAQEVANHLHEANYISRAILLSDGLANVGMVEPDELTHHAAELRLRGVSTTTMGIGADFNEDLLERMAITGGGHFYFIEDARQIPDLLQREFGEVLSTCARQVTLEVELPHGVRARLLNSFESDRDGKRIKVRLDDMIAGEVRTVIFKLSVREGAPAESLPISMSLAYNNVESGEREHARSSEASLTRARAADCDAETPNPEVLEDAALLEAALARDEALRYDRSGQHAQGAAMLAQAAGHLRAMAPASPAVAAEAATLADESRQAAQGLTEMARKEMHYTRSTRLNSRKK